MDLHLMVFASPIFLLLIVIESIFSYYKKSSLYEVTDTINNISSGILEEVASLPLKALLLVTYYYLYEHFAFQHIDPSHVINWFFLWFSVDFCYYWYHRASHRNTFFWVGHSVHHQSERYNLSVALRQGFFQTVTSWIFYLPLALIGFPVWMFVIGAAANTIYQFWIHTETIRTMGWLEKIFNTPSHHRVHHGKNAVYIDKNYAGSLIIWDKLFGTFEPEGVQVEYGVTEPLETWNPFYANIKVIGDLLYYGKHLKNKMIILLALVKPPEWIMEQLEREGTTIAKRKIYIKPTNAPKIYLFVNISLATVLYAYLSFTFDAHSLTSYLLGGLIMLTLAGIGSCANCKTTNQFIELSRAILVILLFASQLNNFAIALCIGLLFFSTNQLFLQLSSLRNFSYMRKISEN